MTRVSLTDGRSRRRARDAWKYELPFFDTTNDGLLDLFALIMCRGQGRTTEP